MKHELGVVAASIESVLSDKQAVQDLSLKALIRNAAMLSTSVVTLDYYVAMEAALKLKEISYVQTESFCRGELKHGTIAPLSEEGTSVIALYACAAKPHSRKYQEVKLCGVSINNNCMDALQEGDDIVVPAVPILLAPIVSVVVTQLIAYYTSLGKLGLGDG